MAGLDRCPVCSAPRLYDAMYCPSCGSRFKTESKTETYRCWLHPKKFGLYRCEICGRLICRECRYEHSAKPICKICFISVVLPRKAVIRFQQSVGLRAGLYVEDDGLVLLRREGGRGLSRGGGV